MSGRASPPKGGHAERPELHVGPFEVRSWVAGSGAVLVRHRPRRVRNASSIAPSLRLLYEEDHHAGEERDDRRPGCSVREGERHHCCSLSARAGIGFTCADLRQLRSGVSGRLRVLPACSAPLTPPAVQEVRKTVTVVFCDVTGSTAMGEKLDPESLRRVMSRYFAEMRAASSDTVAP